MSAEGIRVSFALVDLMQLNLVHRRLTSVADSNEFVHPDDIRALVVVLDDIFGDDAEKLRTMINRMRSANGYKAT